MKKVTKGGIMSKVKMLRKRYGAVDDDPWSDDVLDLCNDVEEWIKNAKAPPGWFDRRSYMRTYMQEWRGKRRAQA